MSKEINNDSALDRYLALKALRENIYAQNPVRYNLLDFADDIPGAGRGLGIWHTDVLPSLGVISKDPQIRKTQIAAAAAKVRDSRANLKSTGKQVLHNAASLGITALPVSAGISALLRLINPRLPISGGKIRNPFTLSKNISKLRSSNSYRKQFLKETLNDAGKGGLYAAGIGAIPPLISSVAKPSDTAISSAEKILENHPYSTSMPGTDIVASLDGDNHKLKNILLGLGIGGSMGALGTFLPPALNIPKRLIAAGLNGKLPMKQISRDFSRAARKNLLLNSAIVGGSGGLGGYLLSKNE